jgi:hypothetical protein
MLPADSCPDILSVSFTVVKLALCARILSCTSSVQEPAYSLTWLLREGMKTILFEILNASVDNFKANFSK